MRKVMRLRWKPGDVVGSGAGSEGWEREVVEFWRLLGPRRCWWRGAVGARMSVRVPVRMRAMVEVMATMETWVAAVVILG